MAALAVTDNIILLIALEYWTVPFDRPYPPIMCHILAYLLSGTYLTGTTFIVAMTVDR